MGTNMNHAKNTYIVFFLLIVTFSSCSDTVDYSVHAAPITINNKTNKKLLFSAAATDKGMITPYRADVLTDNALSPDSSTNISYTWVPGEFSLVCIDFTPYFLSYFSMDIIISTEDHTYQDKGEVTVQIIHGAVITVNITSSPLKVIYTDDEFQELLDQIADEEDKEIIASNYSHESSKWKFNKYNFSTPEFETYRDEILLPLFQKYNLPTDTFFMVRMKSVWNDMPN